jgi:Tol biopolymer transport system component
LPLAAAPAPDPVVNGAQPVVSPRGDRIAFLSNRAGTEDVYVIGARGTGEQRLTHTPEAETGLQWSTGGREIVYSVFAEDTSRLYAIAPGGKNPRELGAVPGRPTGSASPSRGGISRTARWPCSS